MNCTPATLEFYRHSAGAFLSWIESQGVTDTAEVTARHGRQDLSQPIANNRKDTTLHANMRAIWTLPRFWHNEEYIPQPVKFHMSKLDKEAPLGPDGGATDLLKAHNAHSPVENL